MHEIMPFTRPQKEPFMTGGDDDANNLAQVVSSSRRLLMNLVNEQPRMSGRRRTRRSEEGERRKMMLQCSVYTSACADGCWIMWSLFRLSWFLETGVMIGEVSLPRLALLCFLSVSITSVWWRRKTSRQSWVEWFVAVLTLLKCLSVLVKVGRCFNVVILMYVYTTTHRHRHCLVCQHII